MSGGERGEGGGALFYVQVTFGYRVFRYSDELSRGCQVRCQGIC